jgi:hypothetical protein
MSDVVIHTGAPQGYERAGALNVFFHDYPSIPLNNPYIVDEPSYTDIDFFVGKGLRGIYINNINRPLLSLEHCTAYFIQSAANNVPINISLFQNLDYNASNSLSSFLTYYVTGTRMDNFEEYVNKFVPSEQTYLKLKCTYKIPATAVYYFIPNLTDSGNKINILATENVTTFAITSSTGFMIISSGDYEFFIGRYKDQELLVNCRSEYLGTSSALPPVSSFRLPLSSHLIIPSVDNTGVYMVNYNLDYPTLCSSLVTIAKY